jgi:pimeloyl-ACP methyl ester carboxylesterase
MVHHESAGQTVAPATVTPLFLDRPGGRIAYDVTGAGPLIVCLPGMGDLRSVYRSLADGLAGNGWRVATMDLRGHGDSDATFREYDDVAAGTDALALVEYLGGPAIFVGNSMGAGAAAWAAAESPATVAGLVLIGPFVRNVPINAIAALALRLGLLPPWGPAVWGLYSANFYPGRRDGEVAAHRAEIRASLRRPGRWSAFRATSRTSHAPVEARLGEVRAPTLVVMGERDPDFADPRAEAALVADRLHGEVLLVPDAGHYPQLEFPERVLPTVTDFASRVRSHA